MEVPFFCCSKLSSSLLIIDPWAKIKPVAKKREDLYLLDYEALEFFKDLTSSGINVLIVHHQRKADANDPLDAVLGTTGTSFLLISEIVLISSLLLLTKLFCIIPRLCLQNLSLRLQEN